VRIVRSILAVIAMLSGATARAQSFEFHRIDDSALIGALQGVALLGFLRIDNTEVAAFIVRDGGVISCSLWPTTVMIRSARYDGMLPEGTVAVAHNHPLELPRPSRGDIAEAKRIGLPIYVVTRWRVWVVDPSTGDQVELIRDRNWTRGAIGGRCHTL
jgi:hypothetical protein